MKLAMIGLGKMGANMAQRLLQGGHEVVGFDFSADAVKDLETKGGSAASDLAHAVSQLAAPRVVWLMVPAGDPVEKSIAALRPLLKSGDVIVDGGNSLYKDSQRRAESLATDGVHFVDVGTSGGVWGLAEGYSMMVGGSDAALQVLRPALECLAPAADRGWGHVGPSGSGHFVKMVHNGIEYGLMQAYAEGFALMRKKEAYDLDLSQIAEIWRHGSVVRSWLLDLTARALEDGQDLSDLDPWVPDSGEGRWTVMESIELASPAPVIALSLMERFTSRDDDSFSHRLLSAMRNQFGGHAVKRKEG